MDKKKTKKRSKDINIRASQILAETTKEPTEASIREKNPAAVALGHLRGLKGGKARAEKLSAKRRKQIAQKAAQMRWTKNR